MATRKKKEVTTDSSAWPKVNQGTHLTVNTFEDGSTQLVWDDEALLNEVRNAILKAESTIPATSAVTKTKKKRKE